MKERILSLLIGYVLGSILTAEIIVRRKTGRPASEFGSGNPGMANIMRVFGFRAGIAVLAGDLLKTAAAALLSCFLFPEQGQILVLYAGLGAVTGHNWPLWNRLKGGKGVSGMPSLPFSSSAKRPLFSLPYLQSSCSRDISRAWSGWRAGRNAEMRSSSGKNKLPRKNTLLQDDQKITPDRL